MGDDTAFVFFIVILLLVFGYSVISSELGLMKIM